MRSLEELDDLEVMALTVWGEARGEGPDGQKAVAWTIMNRANDPGKDWWGDTIRDVCLKKWQFSVWNDNDPNRAKMLSLSPQDPLLNGIRQICSDTIAGNIPTPIGKCTHYCTSVSTPDWKQGRSPAFTIGRHDFYDIGPGG